MEEKSKRRKLLIDHGSQLKTVFSIVFINLIVFLCILTTLYLVSIRLNKKIDTTITDLNQSIQTEENIVKAFIVFTKSISSEMYEMANRKVTEDHSKSVTIMKKHISDLSKFIAYNRYLLYIILFIQLLGTIAIFRAVLLLSHRVAGPEYVISRMIRKIAAGSMISPRPLRKGDKLNALYKDVIKLAEKRGLIEHNPVKKKRPHKKHVEESIPAPANPEQTEQQ